MYGVYVKTDDKLCIIDVTSSAFLDDATGWVKIDEGVGDKYHHAQGNYLPGPISDERGIWRYQMEAGRIRERSEEEMVSVAPLPPPDPQERIRQLEEALELLLSGVTE